MSAYPSVFHLRQTFERPRVDDVAGTVEAELAKLELRARIRPGQSVAISAGSRGIANIRIIIKAVVDHLRGLGAAPFLVPAMGSHAGGTAEGQQRLLEQYGITAAFCGCPIRSSMETVVVCHAREGFPVHFDRLAYEADHVVVCGRVKPHTSFSADVESGLMKMLLIGLGKHRGAQIYHRAMMDHGFARIVRSVAPEVLARCHIAAGVAVVENAYDETALIKGVRPEDFEASDRELLVLARRWQPRLPFDRVDLLLIDQLGKDISGAGMDTNVVGRKFGVHAPGPDERPEVRYIAIRGLTLHTSGNATGLGLAEFCRSRVLAQRDDAITRLNCCTGGHVAAAMTPLDYETDREILDAALPLMGLTEPADAKLVWIRDTLRLDEVVCSAAYLDEARARADLTILSPLQPLPLDAAGNLPDYVTP